MSTTETGEQVALRAFLQLLGELQSKSKITGLQFREYRELWIKQQPNDRDVTVWHLKQLLSSETKPVTSNETPRKPARQKL
jgi:hypothetical protein